MRFDARFIALTAFVIALSAVCAFADPLDLGKGRQPQAIVDARGTIFITFGLENSIFLTRSADGGKTFDEPINVADVKHLELGMRRGPRIALASGALIITAITGELGGGRDGDVVAFRSEDDGKTWSEPIKVSDVPASAREGLHSMASDGKELVFITWLDLRSGKMQVFGAFSRDAGKTFETNQLVYESPAGFVCECCHPSVVFDASGNVHIMFRNFLDGNRDIWRIVSQDEGKTFENASRLDEQSWKLNACPMDGGAIIADGESFAAAYRREKRIFLSSGGREHFVGEGTQPVLGRDGDGVYIAWIDPNGRLVLRRPFSDQPQAVAESAIDPVLASDGKSRPVLAWEHENHVFFRAMQD